MTAPYRTPALIGCAIIVDREFFFEIGTFDMDMSIWGGENTELSLRTWMCGGAMEIVPCSRMGLLSVDRRESNTLLLINHMPTHRSHNRSLFSHSSIFI